MVSSKDVETRMASGAHLRVIGADRRANQIFFLRGKRKEGIEYPIKNVVFFPGDLQALQEDMLYGSELQRSYAEAYCIESTARALQYRWPHSNIICILPAKQTKDGLAIYNNFLNCNLSGNPDPQRNTSGHALQHLETLLYNLTKMLLDSRGWVEDMGDLCISGFSKGCTVLNQLLYDFVNNGCKLDIQKLIWIDGGHQGGTETWVTNPVVLNKYISMGISTEVHVSPWQVDNENKALIKEEEAAFSGRLLEECEDKFYRKLHFANEGCSLENHFAILNDLM